MDIKQEKEILTDPYAMFMYAIKSPLTRKKYEGRLAKFFNFIGMAGETLEGHWCSFALVSGSRQHASSSGMKSINIETLMGHSIGISDSYYRATEAELLEEYLIAVDLLIVEERYKLEKQVMRAV